MENGVCFVNEMEPTFIILFGTRDSGVQHDLAVSDIISKDEK